MDVDYLLIGQGIAGTLLSRELMKAGSRVMVIDDGNMGASSRVAGGIINPVTGMRLVRSWMIDELLPFARNTYRQMERELGEPLMQELSILDFFAAKDEQAAFAARSMQEKDYLHIGADEQRWDAYFRFNYGLGTIEPCLLLDIGTMLDGWRCVLKKEGALTEGHFESDSCSLTADHVRYGDITARCIIYCDGVQSHTNRYFERLPWSKDKGEVIIASIPALPRQYVYKQGYSIVPWKDDLFWIGATHDWKYKDMQPTSTFRQQVQQQLDYLLKVPYAIVDHLVSQRPVNLERMPFIGVHPAYDTVGIFNGFGGKGCSLAPYFAQQMSAYLLHGTPMLQQVDVARFAKALTRQ